MRLHGQRLLCSCVALWMSSLIACEDDDNSVTNNSTTTAPSTEHADCACPHPPGMDMNGGKSGGPADKVRPSWQGAIWEVTGDTWTPLTCPETCPSNTDQTRQWEKSVLDGINQRRGDGGLAPLERDGCLSALARGKAMRVLRYFDNLPWTWPELLRILGVPSRTVRTVSHFHTTGEATCREWRARHGDIRRDPVLPSIGVGTGRWPDRPRPTVLLFYPVPDAVPGSGL